MPTLFSLKRERQRILSLADPGSTFRKKEGMKERRNERKKE